MRELQAFYEVAFRHDISLEENDGKND